MFVIAFDLNVADVRKAYVKHPRGAYLEIESALGRYGFSRIQDSVFASKDEDLANLFSAISALKELPWFGASVKNLRAFRMEQGSDFTAIVKT